MRRRLKVIVPLAALAVILALLAYRFLLPRLSNARSNSLESIARWFDDPASRPSLTTRMGGKTCPGAPFALPSDGFIGLLWSDPASPYTVLNPHSGVDIFGDGEPGTVPVYAAYAGTLTRRSEWVASLIIRHDDPLQPGRIIWTYYTHMASRNSTRSFIAAAFPPGTIDTPVEQGTLLGYQGEYAGTGAPIGMHVHISLVQSDADSMFRNETLVDNTLDPSPYFGMKLNIADLPARPIGCSS